MNVRPAHGSDFQGVKNLVSRVGIGMGASLKRGDLALKRNLEKSMWSFSKEGIQFPEDELYIFVLERNNEIIGMCAIESNYCQGNGFFSFSLGPNFIELKEGFQNCSYFGSFFVAPGHRKMGCGKLLSATRWNYIMKKPNRFHTRIVTEIRGIYDKDGISPFWEGISSLRFDYQKYTLLLQEGREKDILQSIPKGKISLGSLPNHAKQVINRANPESVGVVALLKNLGFIDSGYIGYSSGAPILIFENQRKII